MLELELGKFIALFNTILGPRWVKCPQAVSVPFEPLRDMKKFCRRVIDHFSIGQYPVSDSGTILQGIRRTTGPRQTAVKCKQGIVERPLN